jgi:hypothetical protein
MIQGVIISAFGIGDNGFSSTVSEANLLERIVMTDSEIKKKMEQISKLSQELDAEAKRRYGKGAQLFLETNDLHFASSVPDDGGFNNRQSGIIFTARNCRIESGAW